MPADEKFLLKTESASCAPAHVLLKQVDKGLGSVLPFVLMDGAEVDKAFGWSKSSRFASIGRGEFTQPVKIGTRSLWPSSEVAAMLEARVRGAADADLRALVRSLHEQRGGATQPVQSAKQQAVVARLLAGKRDKKALHIASKGVA